jgi:hypothetical protein
LLDFQSSELSISKESSSIDFNSLWTIRIVQLLCSDCPQTVEVDAGTLFAD